MVMNKTHQEILEVLRAGGELREWEYEAKTFFLYRPGDDSYERRVRVKTVDAMVAAGLITRDHCRESYRVVEDLVVQAFTETCPPVEGHETDEDREERVAWERELAATSHHGRPEGEDL